MTIPNLQRMTHQQFRTWAHRTVINRPVALQALILAETHRRIYGAVGFVTATVALAAAVLLFVRGQLTFPANVMLLAAVAVPLAFRVHAARRVVQIRQELAP